MDEQTLEILVDLANALEAAAVDVKHKVSEIMDVKKEESWNPERILWKSAQGARGYYEKSTDLNNPDFKELVADLKNHQGKLMHNSFFYWLFESGLTVGRKLRK